jgi:hypothetical protein
MGMNKKGHLVQIKPAHTAAVPAVPGVRLGKIVAIERPDHVWVELPGQAGRLLTRIAIETDLVRLTRALGREQAAVLVFEEADAARPILVGLIGPIAEPSDTQTPFVIEADADGRRVQLTAEDEVVLKCGEASISLKRNGRVVIRGAYVETYASGTNRIKGGNVRIN